MTTHKRFSTVGGSGKSTLPEVKPTATRTFGTVANTAVASPVRAKLVTDLPFDLDGSEKQVSTSISTGVTSSNPAVITTTPQLHRKPKAKVEAAKVKPKAIKSVKPLAAVKDKSKPTPKPTLAPRKAVTEKVENVVATKTVKAIKSKVAAVKAKVAADKTKREVVKPTAKETLAAAVKPVKSKVGVKAAKVIDKAVKEAVNKTKAKTTPPAPATKVAASKVKPAAKPVKKTK